MNIEKQTDGELQSKVAQLLKRHELDGLGADLKALWTAEDTAECCNLRYLADHFNRRLLQSVVLHANVRQVDIDKDGIYQVLTESSATPSERMQAKRRLEREDVDVDALLDDFMSYYRDIKYELDKDSLGTAISIIN